MSAVHPSFMHLKTHRIDSLNIEVTEYQHKKTGASHFHFDADNDENVFLVALRTVPKDSRGVAHILEHTALCGSKKYPVRDPFFMMIRRSLNTFMNALTSSDWTAYPFASLNRKDFDNLLDVYLDAVFFSRLDPLDFAQEGHRLEFEKAEDPSTPLMYKGVVYNEMKGAMSSVSSQLWQNLCKYLYPTSTYHYNSGGEPEHIVDLSYEQLQSFYHSHYHPSNAIFMTYGNIPAEEHQQKFEEKVLKQFDPLDKVISVEDEKRYLAPIRVEEFYAFNEYEESSDGDSKTTENIKAKTHIVMGWLLGKSTDLLATLEAHLVSGLLFDNSASPLQHVLETTKLGTSPSPLCGLDDSQHELTFVCGIEGSDSENSQAFEDLVLSTLQSVSEKGIATEEVEAALHQLELQQREIGGDSYPYGLQLIFTALTGATHRGDAIGLLDVDPVLEQLRENIKDPSYIKKLVKHLFLDNLHRVRLTLSPDSTLAEREVLAEKSHLESIKNSLTAIQQKDIVDQGVALQKRQLQEDDDSILPKVTLDDIPKEMRYLSSNPKPKNFPATPYAVGTNGISYQQIVLPIPQLDSDELGLLPLLTMCLTEMGIADKSYLDIQKRQSKFVGSINAYSSIRASIDNSMTTKGFLVVSAKSLARNQQAMAELMYDTLHAVKFDETSRIQELVAQVRARREQSVTGNGHGLAMLAASAAMSPLAQLNHKLSGLEGIRTIKNLDDSLKDKEQLETLAVGLTKLHQKIIQNKGEFLLISDEQNLSDQLLNLEKSWKFHHTSSVTGDITLPPNETSSISQAWLANSQVNFCAKAFPTVAMTHPDAAALTVLGPFLRNGYLHRAIREQGGAYGSGAQQDSSVAAFKFFSYRDPRLTETLDEFDKSLDWLLNEKHTYQPLEEAILGVVSSIDKPASPAGEAKQTYHAELHGRNRQLRENFRNQILTVTIDDLQRVANNYLKDESASVAVVTGNEGKEASQKLGLELINL